LDDADVRHELDEADVDPGGHITAG
jgi:hypothetical protein